MTWICYRGIELSARIQTALLGIELFTLMLFAVVALIKVYANNPVGSIHVTALVVQPLRPRAGSRWSTVCCSASSSTGAGTPGVAVNEESRDRHRGPGKAAVVSTLILLLIYVVVAAAAQAYHGTQLPRRQFEPTS